MSVLSSPIPLAWSTPLSFSPSSSAGRGEGTWKGRSSSRPCLVEKRESSSSSSSFNPSSSSSTPLSSPDEPLTPPSDSPSAHLASSSQSPFFSSSTRSPTAFLEFALDSSALPRVSKDKKGRRGRRARSLSPPSPASWTGDREVTPCSTKPEGSRSEKERGRGKTTLPEGWEHIPWITSSSLEEEGDLLDWRTKAKEEEDGERPPSPPQTPSPRLSDAGPILETPPAPASPASSTSTRRRAVTRSDLPTLRDQLSSSPPRQTSTRAPKEKEKSRSEPTSPTKPRCETVESSTAVQGKVEGKEREPRRRWKSLSAKEGGGKRRAREERMESREEVVGSEESTCAPGLGITIPSATTSSSSSSTQGTFATPSSSSCTPSLSPSCSCDSSDSEEPSDHFTTHFQSLPLLRLRHALSLAATFAALPPTTTSSRAASQRYLSTPVLSSPRPSSSAFTRSVVSEQYRLYAMGRAKAKRTGGVGYWEGGREVWAGVLED